MISLACRRLVFAAAWLAVAKATLLGQVPRDRVVEVRASVLPAPPRITLFWNVAASGTLTEQRVYRRLKGGPAWIELASLPVTATSYADRAVEVGTSYEYFVHRVFSGGPDTASGYLNAGVRVPFVAERGKVILLVDDTMATPLAAELAQFSSDLAGDGWQVLRQDVSRSASVPSVRAVVQSIYQADPAKTAALILLGHIPVPYSGDFAPDGHPDHVGAWPADAYYGDVDGTWTDSTVTDTQAASSRNVNVPGDGKFDQTEIPSDVELEVGRIDLANMTAYSASETELLRQYLARDHDYRHRLGAFANIPRRGLIDDNFGYFGGEAFATPAWRSFIACFGSANVKALDWFGTLQTEKYLCAYGCGAGAYNMASGIGSTSDFAAKDSRAVFSLLFGSYFGDWDSQDNFLRAPLGGTAGSLGLASAWVGRPYWYFHHLALGETIGYAARLAQNNTTSFPGGYEENYGARFVHIALMGDPTLRLHCVKPPADLVATARGHAIALSWTRSFDAAIAGYIVSRAPSPAGPFQRVRGAMVASPHVITVIPGARYTYLPSPCRWIDRTVTPGASYTYMVRAVKRESGPSGTYFNPSQGIFSAPATAAAASGPEMNITGDGSPVADGDTLAMEANGTDFGTTLLGQPGVRHTFTIHNAGAAMLRISRAQLVGGQAGDFSIDAPPPAAIAPGGSASFQISFHPSATGSRRTRLWLRSNDPDEALFDFALAGIGEP